MWLDFLWLPTHFACEVINTSVYLAVYLVHDLCLTDGLRQTFLVLPGLQGVFWGPTHKPSPPWEASVEFVCVTQRTTEFLRTFFITWRNHFLSHNQENFVQKVERWERKSLEELRVGEKSIWRPITSKELLKMVNLQLSGWIWVTNIFGQ